MELFRSRPNLCSLFLRVLDEWGCQSLDWTMLRDEAFVDAFLRQLLLSPEMDESDVFKAGVRLLQPSIGGLLVAPRLKQGGYFDEAEMEAFVHFTLAGTSSVWKSMSWTELVSLLEEIVFPSAERAVDTLYCLVQHGWVAPVMLQKFLRRVWQTDRMSWEDKIQFFSRIKGVQGLSRVSLALPILQAPLRQSGAFMRLYRKRSRGTGTDSEAASCI